MHVRAPLALILAGLVGFAASAPRPCDGDTPVPSSTSAYVPPPPTVTVFTSTRKHHHGHHSSSGPVTLTETITVSTTKYSTHVSTETLSPPPSTTSVTIWKTSDVPSSTSPSAAATTTPTSGSGSGSSSGQCNTGPVQCCNQVQEAGKPAAQDILKGLALAIGADVPVGLNCSPIDLLGGGSGAICASTPVCCENNTFNGLINIGCVPIVLQL